MGSTGGFRTDVDRIVFLHMSIDPRSSSVSQASSESDRPATLAGESFVSAFRDPASHARLWLVAALGLAADLLSKHWAFTRLPTNPNIGGWVAIKGLMAFQRSLNPGALFGLGKGLTPVFIAASLLALGFVVFLFYHSTRQRRSLHFALGLVLAGALGNLYDRAYMIADVVKFTENGHTMTVVGRIVNPGQTPMRIGVWPGGEYARPIAPESNPQPRQLGVVRDFVKIQPQFKLRGHTVDVWPWVFNVADVLLVFGVSILMLNFWWERRQEKAAGGKADSAQASPRSSLNTPA